MCFQRHFGDDDQKILAPFTAMIQAELFQGNQTYTVVISIILNSFPSMPSLIRSTVQQKKRDFRGMTVGFLSAVGLLSPFIVPHNLL